MKESFLVMDDWKKELLKIKSNNKIGESTGTDKLVSETKKIKIKEKSVKSYLNTSKVNKKQSFIELPTFGIVKTFVSDKGFGFVKTNKGEYFFHINNKEERTDDYKNEIIINAPMVFTLAISPRNGKIEAARWELLKYVGDAEIHKVKEQAAYDRYRGIRLKKLTVENILQIIQGIWYDKYSKNNDKGLNDDVLEEVLQEKIKHLSISDWNSLQIMDILSKSPYTFSESWNLDDEEHIPKQLLNCFSTEYLAQIAVPKYTWFGICIRPLSEAKIFEWALRCDLGESKHLWEQELEDIE